jgi:threonine/homoserine/homoserine lactone efflux protein
MIILDGFFTGLMLQIAIGPVFFYILNLTLQRSLLDGFMAVGAAVLVDYFYICLAILGLNRALENQRLKVPLSIFGSVVLGIFGWVMISTAGQGSLAAIPVPSAPKDLLSSFLSTLVLTISSPLTILFWTSLFAAKATEKGYSTKELVSFGLGAGLATVVFMGSAVTGTAFLKLQIPPGMIRILNTAVGLILILFGLMRLLKMIREMRKFD